MARKVYNIHPARRFFYIYTAVHAIQLFDKFCRQKFPGSTDTCYSPPADGNETVTVHGSDVQVMNGSYDCHIQTFHDIHDFKLVLDIQMVGRFVKDKAFRLLRERSGKYDNAAVPRRKEWKSFFRQILPVLRHARRPAQFYSLPHCPAPSFSYGANVP